MTLPRVQPIAPTWHKEPFDDPDWLFDFKYDGFRAVCYLERRRNRLISRNNNIMTRFDALADQVAVSAVVLAFLWGATQWVAWRLAFQPQLGHPWFNILGWPVYDPPAIFWWWFAYDAYARPIFVESAYIAASGGIAAIVVAVAMSVWRAREVKKVTTYGSARWA